MISHSVTIKGFSLGSLLKWGFLAAAIVGCLPAFLCSWIFFTTLSALKGMIGGWGDVGFTVLGQRLSFNLIDLLNLQGFYRTLTDLTARGIGGIILLALLGVIAFGVFGALVLLVLGAFYNATGRIQVEVEHPAPKEPVAQTSGENERLPS